MKTEIFSEAIKNRSKVKFLYFFQELTIDPYFISIDKYGRKVLYGKPDNMNVIKRFEYSKMSNIKTLNYQKFSPIIPILTSA